MFSNASPYETLFDVLRRRQGTGFIGRSPLLHRFRQQLRLSPDHPQRPFITLISGQAGVGKTWLMARLQRIAQVEIGARTAWGQGRAEDAIAIMVQIAHQLAQAGVAMPAFARAYANYQEAVRTLARELDQSSGIRVFSGHPLLAADVTWSRREHDWGFVAHPDPAALARAAHGSE
jgi:hypothetical protein